MVGILNIAIIDRRKNIELSQVLETPPFAYNGFQNLLKSWKRIRLVAGWEVVKRMEADGSKGSQEDIKGGNIFRKVLKCSKGSKWKVVEYAFFHYIWDRNWRWWICIGKQRGGILVTKQLEFPIETIGVLSTSGIWHYSTCIFVAVTFNLDIYDTFPPNTPSNISSTKVIYFIRSSKSSPWRSFWLQCRVFWRIP